MRTRLTLILLAVGLAAAPGAHAASATLTNPSNGATYYTGAGSTAQVPVSATRGLTGCSNGPNTTFNVVFRTLTGAAAGGTNATTDSISRSVLVPPGDYTAQANTPCGGQPALVYSNTNTFHVVKGNAPTISDRDLDGVTDANDECPDIPGAKTNAGCPVLDEPGPKGDGDKVPKAKDRCDDEAGPAWTDGCEVRVPRAPKRKPELRARRSTKCTLARLRSEARRKAPPMRGGAQVAKLRRCYAKGVPGVTDGWPLISFWSNATFKPAFEVYPPELRPQNAPPITRVRLRARKGFNVYAVKKETTEAAVFLPVFSILTAESTPTNTGGRLQVGVVFPAKGNSGYRRIKL